MSHALGKQSWRKVSGVSASYRFSADLGGPASVGLATPGRADVTEQGLPGQFDPRSEGRW